MDVVAIFCQVFWVTGIKGQSISAGFQFGHVVVAFPVLVAGSGVWVESEIVRTFETVLSIGCKTKKKQFSKMRLDNVAQNGTKRFHGWLESDVE